MEEGELINIIKADLELEEGEIVTIERLANSYLNDVYKIITAKATFCLKHCINDQDEAERQYEALRVVSHDGKVNAAQPMAINTSQGFLYTKWIEGETVADLLSHKNKTEGLLVESSAFLANLHQIRGVTMQPMDFDRRLLILLEQVPKGTSHSLDKIYTYLDNNRNDVDCDWAYGHGDYKPANLFVAAGQPEKQMLTIDLDLNDNRPIYYDMAAFFVNYLFLSLKHLNIRNILSLSRHIDFFISAYEDEAQSNLNRNIFKWIFLAQLYLRIGLALKDGAPAPKRIIYAILLKYYLWKYAQD